MNFENLSKLKISASQIKSVYKFSSRDLYWKRDGNRSFHIIAYHTTGKNKHLINGKTLNIKSGTVLFLSKNDPYEVFVEEHTESLCVAVSLDIDVDSFCIDFEDSIKIKSLFQQLVKNCDLSKTSDLFQAISLLYQVFYLMQKRLDVKYAQTSQIKLKLAPALEYVQANVFEQNITNTTLASLCNVTERHFISLFKASYLETPKQYIIEQKIKKAIELISLNVYTLSEISNMCGFVDNCHFSKYFKKSVGVSPSEYAKRYKN